MEINFSPTLKQDEVFDLLSDDHTTELLFGGGVGSAKTYLLAAAITMSCLANAGVRVGLARNELTTLKKNSLTSFFELFANWGLLPDKHYKYNSVAGEIKFINGSAIIMQELRYLPSDPDYVRLGGLLLTWGAIDEAGECDERGKEIFQSRLGRWQNDVFGLKPVLLMTCNPARNFLDRDFYRPFVAGTLPSHRKFVSATVKDNPYISSAYVENLKRTLSNTEVQRLIHGNWDYDGHPDNLLTYDQITAMYSSEEAAGEMYISADIAFTSDRCVILVWQGHTITHIKVMNKDDNVEQVIQKMAEDHKVPAKNIAYDSDGVGKYLMNYLKAARPIVNNARPFRDENYKNLKHQLYFALAKKISDGGLHVATHQYRSEIEEELAVIRHKPRDTTDGKIETNSKADVKRLIGRSPDFADAMAYRMVFDFTNSRYVFV